MKPGNAGGAKAPCSDANTQSGKSPGIGASLSTPLDSVRTLQSALRAKAKSEAAYRFYSLWDKVCREDVVHEAYRRCRANRGAPGVDGETFAHIDEHGVAAWLQRLRQELRTRRYRCAPLLRVWIPKANGGQRPLGIPTIRDRVAQMAVLLVLGPIFDEDLFPWQYGFREGMDAKMALRRIHFGIADRGAREVVDAEPRMSPATAPTRSFAEPMSQDLQEIDDIATDGFADELAPSAAVSEVPETFDGLDLSAMDLPDLNLDGLDAQADWKNPAPDSELDAGQFDDLNPDADKRDV
jgi:hypothetical protein